jgi:hypothetical protein
MTSLKKVAGDKKKERAEIDSKYLQPKWCPPGLNKTQRLKLQRAWHKQQEREKLAMMEGEVVNSEQVKNPLEDRCATATAANPAKPTPGPAKPAHPTVETTEPASEAAKLASSTATALEVPESAKPTLVSADPTPIVSMASEVSSDDFARTVADMVGMEVLEVLEEEMVDYEPTSEREVNVVVLSADYYIVEDDSAAAVFNFPIEDATFKKLGDPVNHLKPLHIKGHINGALVHGMLVDSGAIVNVMSYPLYKKLGDTDDELVKTNMTITGVGGGTPIPARGIANMELTVGSKTLATAFFMADVQGSYNLILGRDWIHANCCVPSSLHQFLIQWVGDAVEIVHSDSSADVATADAPVLGGHDAFGCLSDKDLSSYEFISVTRQGFVHVSLKLIDNRFNIIM